MVFTLGCLHLDGKLLNQNILGEVRLTYGQVEAGRRQPAGWTEYSHIFGMAIPRRGSGTVC